MTDKKYKEIQAIIQANPGCARIILETNELKDFNIKFYKILFGLK